MIPYNECTVGRLVNTAFGGLKVAIIVGVTRTGKIRVCKWSDNARHWSGPQNLRERELEPIELAALSSRHRRIVQYAHDNVRDASGSVKHSKGESYVGGAPFLGAVRAFSRAKEPAQTRQAIPKIPPSDVTKLAPAIGVASSEPGSSPIVLTDESRANLKKLNAQLTTALFGKGK